MNMPFEWTLVWASRSTGGSRSNYPRAMGGGGEISRAPKRDLITRRRDHARRRKAVPWGGRRAAGAQTQARRKRSPARRFPLSFSRATETMSATFALSAAASARRAYPAPSTATRHRGNVRHVAARDSCVAGVGASGLAPGAGARARGLGRARRGVVYARVETRSPPPPPPHRRASRT